jgi:AcrR family transcriptional regulator
VAPAEQRRTWAGSTMDERRAQRREQLITAARELLGSGATVSVRAVCRSARLTERYFYESFDDRDALVIVAYERASQEAVAAIAEAVAASDGSPEAVARAAVRVAVEQVVDDPSRGHVLIVAPLTNPVLFEKREELVPVLTALIREQLPGRTSESERDMVALGIAGALTQIFYSYLTGRLVVDRDTFVEHCVRLLLSAGAMWPGKPR